MPAGHIALLTEIGERVTGRPLTSGNSLRIFQGGDQTYPEMLKAIGEARSCIALETYIFRNDAVGHAFVDALVAARTRGVDVRVLLDSVGTGYLAGADPAAIAGWRRCAPSASCTPGCPGACPS